MPKNKTKHEEAKNLILEKKTPTEIAQITGFSRENIYYIRKKMGLSPLDAKKRQKEKEQNPTNTQ